jgi:GDP-L-fucose synthase
LNSETLNKTFWRSRRIVVTGGAGFLGSAVVRRLEQLNPEDITVPRSKEYDLRERDAIRDLIATAKPNLVLHLAAKVGGIGANQDHPAVFFYDNLMMGVQLFHECWVSGVEKFVGIGTVCSYPKFAPIPFKEESLWDGYPEETNAAYGLAKKNLIVQSVAYESEYGFDSINVIPVNLYGPGDNFDPESSHVIPALIRRMLEARDSGTTSVEIWGDGSATREFLFVDDAARGLILASERYRSTEPVNLGSGEEISIKDLVTKIAHATGFDGRIVWDTSKPNGQPRRKLDTTRAEREFGFTSSTKFDKGLALTVEWYKSSTQ